MTVGTGVSLALALVIGLTLGALGGGGSILTLPAFVFVAGIPAQETVAMLMVVVGGASLLGAGLHWRNGNFHIKATLLFAATGVIGAYAGSFLPRVVSQRVLFAEKVPSVSLSRAFGWFVAALAPVISGLAAAGVRTAALNG